MAALIEGQQVAIFLLPGAGDPASRLRAVDNRDPVTGANVLARGLTGSTDLVDYVASPMLKHRFDLASGRCLDGVSPGVKVWPARVWGRTVEVLAVTGDAPSDASTPTHCPFCALQCGMRLRPPAGGGGVEAESDPSFPVNRGRMCVKGWASVGLIRNPSRLTHPLVRDASGRLKEASWDEALGTVAARIVELQSRHGADAVGVFGSGALTNEKAYLLGKFARVALRSANIDYNGRFCMSSAAAAQNRAFGLDRGLPFPLSDLSRTAGLVLWGANPADTMPPLMQWVDAMRAGGGLLAVVDPRRTATAQAADLHVRPVPGTDLAVALGLLCLADRSGVVDSPYIAARTSGFEEVLRSVEPWIPSRVEAVSGVTPTQLQKLLDVLASGTSSMLLTGRGPEQQSKGVDTCSALINLALALGRVGRPASGYGCLTGQANGQGGREHGQKADQLPGYRSITDHADRDAVAGVWGVDPSALPGPGMSASEMLASDQLRGLLVFGSDLAVAGPNTNATRASLEGLDLLVVADTMITETAEMADAVLPVTVWAEEEGTTTNLEGRVLRRRRAVEPPPGVRTDVEVLCAVAERLACSDGFRYPSTEALFDELRRASAGGRADYSGISYGRLDSEPGLFWPCPSEDHPGTPRLFAERFAHPDGRARMVAVDYRAPAEEPDDKYPLYLTTGRNREHYNSGSQTRRLERLSQTRPVPRLQLNPALALLLGVVEGDSVLAESRRGSAVFEVDIDDGIREDTVFLPFHWGGPQAANLLTSSALDPVSRMPEFKVCAVRLTRS